MTRATCSRRELDTWLMQHPSHRGGRLVESLFAGNVLVSENNHNEAIGRDLW